MIYYLLFDNFTRTNQLIKAKLFTDSFNNILKLIMSYMLDIIDQVMLNVLSYLYVKLKKKYKLQS